MSLTAREITNSREFAPGLVVHERGVEASRAYLIEGTADFAAAALAAGLPRVGDAYAAGNDLYASSVRFELLEGRNVRAVVAYKSPEAGSATEPKPPRTPADSYTVLESGAGSINVLYAWNALGNANFNLPPDFGPINAGRGIADDRGTLAARVVRYFTSSADFDLARCVLLASEGAVNDASLSLPPVSGLFPVTLQAGQAKFKGFDGPELAVAPPAAPQRLYKVTYRLALDFDHIARYTETNVTDGTAIGRAVHLAPRRSFAGLW